jgi:hypothetical protein
MADAAGLRPELAGVGAEKLAAPALDDRVLDAWFRRLVHYFVQPEQRAWAAAPYRPVEGRSGEQSCAELAAVALPARLAPVVVAQ